MTKAALISSHEPIPRCLSVSASVLFGITVFGEVKVGEQDFLTSRDENQSRLRLKMANFAPLTAATGSFRAHHAVSMDYDVDGTILLRCTAVDTSKALCLRQESGKMGLLEASSGVRRSPGHQIYGTPAPSKRHFRHLRAWAGRQYLSRLAGDRHKATIRHGASPGAAKSQLDKIIGVTDGWEL